MQYQKALIRGHLRTNFGKQGDTSDSEDSLSFDCEAPRETIWVDSKFMKMIRMQMFASI